MTDKQWCCLGIFHWNGCSGRPAALHRLQGHEQRLVDTRKIGELPLAAGPADRMKSPRLGGVLQHRLISRGVTAPGVVIATPCAGGWERSQLQLRLNDILVVGCGLPGGQGGKGRREYVLQTRQALQIGFVLGIAA